MADLYKWYTPEEYADELLEDFQDNHYKGLLQEVRDLRHEYLDLSGGGPNWVPRMEATWKKVDEAFANDDEAAYDRQQEDYYG